MRVVIQRVAEASVILPREGDVSGQIGHGLLALVGLQRGDTDSTLDWMANKLLRLRVFPDTQDKMNLSVLEVPDARILLVPNFTVGCDIGKGLRPSFDTAMPSDAASGMFKEFVEKFSGKGINVETGVFGSEMHVRLCNDGPVTFVIESQDQ
ncbi:MAG: D-aminoacyl-tRNA deacylase [Phycisphaera sp.]|nr:MAG: D-aminoacyl-tRNA deacylase [Phycisphaera sp.]